FGLQGADQAPLLMNLIFETVAKGEWANVPPPPNNPMGMVEDSILPVTQQNSLGYYPPAKALIVRGTSRYHTAATIKLTKMEGMAAAPGAPRPGGGVLVIGPGGNPNPKPVGDPNVKPMGDPVVKKPDPTPTGPIVITGDKPTLVDPRVNVEAMLKKI